MINLNDAIQALNIKNFSVKSDVITEKSFNETYREFNVQGEVSMEVGEPTITWSQVKAKYDELKSEYDSKQYQRDRAESYPDLAEQFDLLWHAIDDGKFNVKSKDTDFYKKLKAVKDANPKPE